LARVGKPRIQFKGGSPFRTDGRHRKPANAPEPARVRESASKSTHFRAKTAYFSSKTVIPLTIAPIPPPITRTAHSLRARFTNPKRGISPAAPLNYPEAPSPLSLASASSFPRSFVPLFPCSLVPLLPCSLAPCPLIHSSANSASPATAFSEWV
jgi:hypothetical protein